MVGRRSAWGSGWVLVTLLTGVASAQPPAPVQATLLNDAPRANCPDQTTLQAQVQQCLRPEAARAGHRLVAEVRITAVGSTLEGRLRMTSAGRAMGERRLIGAHDCRALVEAAALALCIALDAMAAAQPVAAAPAVAPAKVPQPATPTAAVPPILRRLPQPRPPQVLRWGLSGGATFSGGIEPGAALGVALATELRWPAAAVGLEVRFDPPTTTRAGAGLLRAWLVAGSALLCGRADWFAMCGVGSLGVRGTAGVDFDQDRGATSSYAAAGLRFTADWALSRSWFLVSSAEVSRSLIGVDAVVDDQVVWQSPPVGLLAGIAVAWRPKD